MEKRLTHIWAKTSKDDAFWHPLILHMLDVAASAEAVLEREPEPTRQRMAEALGMGWGEAKPWLLFLIACHDLGKASPAFYCKWEERPDAGLSLPRNPKTKASHAFISQIALRKILCGWGWPDELAKLAADAVGCHHGSRASSKQKMEASSAISIGSGERLETVKNDWNNVRNDLAEALRQVLDPVASPTKETLTGPDFMLLSGLTSFSDWIGSNEKWFPFGTPADCNDLHNWFQKSRTKASDGLDKIGWQPRLPLASTKKPFQEIFHKPPRPLQQATEDALEKIEKPSAILIEAPMGEGKTEAAFFAYLELQRKFGHRGMYVAMPTKATGNAMFDRTFEFLRAQNPDRTLDLQLLHGGAFLNEKFQDIKVSNIYDDDSMTDPATAHIRAVEWFTNKKRALLSEYGVGTLDQALIPILPVRHYFVRLWGLANRVVILDEIHAYDAYTGTLLVYLLLWLLALGSSVVLLSATLAPSAREELAKKIGVRLPDEEAKYPRLSVFTPGSHQVMQTHFKADPSRRLSIQLTGIAPDVEEMHQTIQTHLPSSGKALMLVNTVGRAQSLYQLFGEGRSIEHKGQRVGKCLADNSEAILFHGRFPADQRQRREEYALATFGKSSPQEQAGRKILIATQVAEQSLDLDFDLIITDLAPIDLILQRAGRLWRHARSSRPVSSPMLFIAGLDGCEPPSFGKPLWWGKMYQEAVLLYTWILLKGKSTLTLPDEIDILVKKVYGSLSGSEKIHVPESLREQLESKLSADYEGKKTACRQQAQQAIIGLPDDGSFNDPNRFVLYDEDDPKVHHTLKAQTRIGDDSVIVVPLYPKDNFCDSITPDFIPAKKWALKAISITRKNVVAKLRQHGVPKGWEKSPLLRAYFPLQLDESGQWIEDNTVQLDENLGLVYKEKKDQ